MAGKNASLKLDFVYGYHGSRCRDNLFYIETGEIVYHIAGVGIVYDQKTHTQRFFLGHNDDIISLTLHPNGRYVATGQIGKSPYIAIWDAITMETVAMCSGFHERGICSLGFSEDGKYLVSVGLDDDHTIAWWDWQAGRVIANDRASKDRIFDIEPSPYSNLLVSCGVKHIKFWMYSGNSLVQKRGILGEANVGATMLCICFGHNDGKTYTGTLNGEVFIWEENKLVKVVKAHKGPVYTVSDFDGGFLTGGKDGAIKVWDKDFNYLHSIPVGKYNIRSITWGNGKILVGTKNSEILEIVYDKENSKMSLLIEGHGEGELWGLAVNSKNNQFVTASDDMMVKVWDGKTKKCLLTIETKYPARSCCFSADGNTIAVGFGNGSFGVYSTKDGKEIFSKKERKEQISVIRYSPDGQFLAVGSHDNFVDIYDAKYTKTGTCTGNSSFITHFDWSTDSKLIMTNSGAYESLYFQVPAGTRVTKKPSCEWATSTCILGENIKGIWPPYSDKTDVNAVDKNKSGDLIVTGDDFGLVKLFKYPCPDGTPFKKFVGHSAHVTCVRWAADSSYVLSTGGGDQAVMQWKLITDTDEDHEVHNVEENMDSDVEREKEVDYDRKEKPVEEEAPVAGGLFQLGGASEVVKSGRPSLQNRPRVPPGGKPEPGKSVSGAVEGQSAPDKDLELEFIYGYRGYDTRNNLGYLASGDLVYHVAAAGIVYNKKNHTQKFFLGHTDDIISLALHPERKLVATGQVGKDPAIMVWDSTTMERLSTLQGFHERGVCSLSFSPDGQYLVSVGLDDKHSICVWKWKDGTRVASAIGSQEKIMGAQYNPYVPDTIVSVGIKHIAFWKAAGNTLVSKKGIFGGKGEIQTILSIAFDKNHTYTGTNSGDIYKWSDTNLVAVIPAHKGPVFDICATKDGFATGGKDGCVQIWGAGFKESKSVDLNPTSSPFVVKSVNYADGKVIVGGRDGQIVEVVEGKVTMLLQGHGMGELWGLATHPNKHIFLTASDDKTIRLWDADHRKPLVTKSLGKMLRSAAFSPDGNLVAAGTSVGGFIVFKASTLEEVVSKKDRKESVSDLKFAPNGRFLAVGTHDNFVDIYETDKWTKVGKCAGSSSYITHVDWAEDSELLVSNSGAYEQLFFRAPQGNRVDVSKKAFVNMNWASITGILGLNMTGIWPKFSDGTDINAVDVTKTRDVVATGDDFGFVKLFAYPSPQEFAKCKQHNGHSAHVTNVRFTYDDNYLLSTGGADTAVFQWKYKKNGTTNETIVEEAYDSDVEKEKSINYKSRADLADEFHNDVPTEEGQDTPASGGLFQLGSGSEVVKSGRPTKGTASKEYDTDYHHNTNDQVKDVKNLTLEYIYGYRAHDARNNLFYTSAGDLVYHVAGAGVLLNPKNNTQRHYLEHTDDIVSLAYHPGLNVVATGQVGRTPQICVWNPDTLKTEAILKGTHGRAICALSFSASGKLLASVDETDNHVMVVWRWKDGMKVANANVSKDKIFDVTFNPFNEDELVTVGDKHIKFWKVAGNSLEEKRGVFGSVGALQSMLCSAFDANGVCYTGAISGEIFVWNGTSLSKVIKAHDGPVFSINSTSNGEYISGGKDVAVKRWAKGLASVKESINLPDHPSRTKPVVRSVAEHNGNIVIGTQTSEIYELGSDKKIKLLTEGHSEGELWGLAAHPSRNLFATAADDKTLRIWDIQRKTTVAVVNTKVAARSAAFSPDGNKIAVGFANGSFAVYDVSSMEELCKKRSRKEAIHEMKFSPDGKFLAVGSHDNFVDIYSTDDWKCTGVCKGNSSFITHLDFSADSTMLTTNSGAYEQLIFDVPSGKMTGGRGLVDKLNAIDNWATWTGVLGQNVEGIWPPGSDKTDVNATDLSHKRDILATGDDFGFVKLFAWPVTKKGASFKKYIGHSAHVTTVRFSYNDSYLISTGGGDRSVFQWKLQ